MKKETTIIPNHTELEKQFEYINPLIEQHRSSAIAKVNTEALKTNWEVGQYISQQLKSAHWGAKVVSDLADYLKRMNPKRRGYSKRNLYNMVKFYDLYSAKDFARLTTSLKIEEIVQLPTAQIEECEIVQLPTAQLDKPFANMPKILALNTFTSRIEILNRCKSYEERVFYVCPSADRSMVEYTLSRSLSPTMVAEYQRKLIPQEVMRKSLEEYCTFLKESQNS